MSYAREKLWQAAQSLAVSSKPIQKRLEYAMLSCGVVQPNSFPRDCPEAVEEWKEIERRCTQVTDGPTENGLIKNTLAIMGDEEAEEIARLIWNLLWKVERHEREKIRHQSIQSADSRAREASH